MKGNIMKFEYQKNHLPTGTITRMFAEFMSAQDFLRFLNEWNVNGKGQYIYTATDRSFLSHSVCSHDFRSETIVQKPLRNMDDVNAAGGYWQPVNNEGTQS